MLLLLLDTIALKGILLLGKRGTKPCLFPAVLPTSGHCFPSVFPVHSKEFQVRKEMAENGSLQGHSKNHPPSSPQYVL
jgi:hypothetical protein